MTAIRSGPHTCNSSTSTSSIKHVVPTEFIDFLNRPPVMDTHHGARLLRPRDLWMAQPL
jgi:hypothetical protein